jgi:hypothetical protein
MSGWVLYEVCLVDVMLYKLLTLIFHIVFTDS